MQTNGPTNSHNELSISTVWHNLPNYIRCSSGLANTDKNKTNDCFFPKKLTMSNNTKMS